LSLNFLFLILSTFYDSFSKQISLLTVARDNSITPITTITTSFFCSSICPIDKDTFLVGTVRHSRPVRTVTVQGQEGNVQHGSLPNKSLSLGDSWCTFVQHKKTVVIADSSAHKVHLKSLGESGWTTTVHHDLIREPQGVCGGGDRGSVFVCAKRAIVQLSSRGDVVASHNVGFIRPCTISVSNDGRKLMVANARRNKVNTIKLYRVEY